MANTMMSGEYGQLKVIDSKSNIIKQFPLKLGTNAIGNGPQATVRILKNDILPIHFCIEVTEDKMTTITSSSTMNPTYLNDKILRKGKSKLLQPLDTIVIGNIKIAYENSSLNDKEIEGFQAIVKKNKLSTPRRGTIGLPRCKRHSFKANREPQPWRWELLDRVMLPSSPLSQEIKKKSEVNIKTDFKVLENQNDSGTFVINNPSSSKFDLKQSLPKQEDASSVLGNLNSVQEELSPSVENLIKIASKQTSSKNKNKKNSMLQSEVPPFDVNRSIYSDITEEETPETSIINVCNDDDERFKTPNPAPFFAPLVQLSSEKSNKRVSDNLSIDKYVSTNKISSALKSKTPVIINKHRRTLRNSTGKLMKKPSDVKATLSLSFNISDRRNYVPKLTRAYLKSKSFQLDTSINMKQNSEPEQCESKKLSLYDSKQRKISHLRNSSTPKPEQLLDEFIPKETAIVNEKSLTSATLDEETSKNTPTIASNSFIYESTNFQERSIETNMSGIHILETSNVREEEEEEEYNSSVKNDCWSPIYCSSSTSIDESEIDENTFEVEDSQNITEESSDNVSSTIENNRSKMNKSNQLTKTPLQTVNKSKNSFEEDRFLPTDITEKFLDASIQTRSLLTKEVNEISLGSDQEEEENSFTDFSMNEESKEIEQTNLSTPRPSKLNDVTELLQISRDHAEEAETSLNIDIVDARFSKTPVQQTSVCKQFSRKDISGKTDKTNSTDSSRCSIESNTSNDQSFTDLNVIQVSTATPRRSKSINRKESFTTIGSTTKGMKTPIQQMLIEAENNLANIMSSGKKFLKRTKSMQKELIKTPTPRKLLNEKSFVNTSSNKDTLMTPLESGKKKLNASTTKKSSNKQKLESNESFINVISGKKSPKSVKSVENKFRKSILNEDSVTESLKTSEEASFTITCEIKESSKTPKHGSSLKKRSLSIGNPLSDIKIVGQKRKSGVLLDKENENCDKSETLNKVSKLLSTPKTVENRRRSSRISSVTFSNSFHVLTEIMDDKNTSTSSNSNGTSQPDNSSYLQNTSSIKESSSTPIYPANKDTKNLRRNLLVKEPLNDLSDVKGVRKLLTTPKLQNEPVNDLRNITGVKNLFTLPKETRSPLNDLRDIRGVKKLFRSAKAQKEPRNNLDDVTGVKQLFSLKKNHVSPKNDLTDIAGVKKLMKTPKPQKEPLNDLQDIKGVKQLFVTPKNQRSPNNDLSDVQGVKKLFKTPKVHKSPHNDLENIVGIKKLFVSTSKQQSPENDLTKIVGLKRLMKTPKPINSPKNDLTNVYGVKALLKTPKISKPPKNDLRDVQGVKQLFHSSKKSNSPKNDLTDVRGVKKLMKTPKQKQDILDVTSLITLMASPDHKTTKRKNSSEDTRTTKKFKSSKVHEPDYTDVTGIKRMFLEEEAKFNNKINVSGVSNLFSDEFDKLVGKEPLRQYPGKISPTKISPLSQSKITLESSVKYNPRVEHWVKEQNQKLPNTSTPINKVNDEVFHYLTSPENQTHNVTDDEGGKEKSTMPKSRTKRILRMKAGEENNQTESPKMEQKVGRGRKAKYNLENKLDEDDNLKENEESKLMPTIVKRTRGRVQLNLSEDIDQNLELEKVDLPKVKQIIETKRKRRMNQNDTEMEKQIEILVDSSSASQIDQQTEVEKEMKPIEEPEIFIRPLRSKKKQVNNSEGNLFVDQNEKETRSRQLRSKKMQIMENENEQDSMLLNKQEAIDDQKEIKPKRTRHQSKKTQLVNDDKKIWTDQNEMEIKHETKTRTLRSNKKQITESEEKVLVDQNETENKKGSKTRSLRSKKENTADTKGKSDIIVINNSLIPIDSNVTEDDKTVVSKRTRSKKLNVDQSETQKLTIDQEVLETKQKAQPKHTHQHQSKKTEFGIDNGKECLEQNDTDEEHEIDQTEKKKFIKTRSLRSKKGNATTDAKGTLDTNIINSSISPTDQDMTEDEKEPKRTRRNQFKKKQDVNDDIKVQTDQTETEDEKKPKPRAGRFKKGNAADAKEKLVTIIVNSSISPTDRDMTEDEIEVVPKRTRRNQLKKKQDVNDSIKVQANQTETEDEKKPKPRAGRFKKGNATDGKEKLNTIIVDSSISPTDEDMMEDEKEVVPKRTRQVRSKRKEVETNKRKRVDESETDGEKKPKPRAVRSKKEKPNASIQLAEDPSKTEIEKNASVHTRTLRSKKVAKDINKEVNSSSRGTRRGTVK